MSSPSSINCQHCGFSQLCLPFTLNDQELDKLDQIIQRKRPSHKGDHLFEAGKPLQALYAVRTGSFKTYTLTEQGEEQITGFHLPGDVIGFDAIATLGKAIGLMVGTIIRDHIKTIVCITLTTFDTGFQSLCCGQLPA